MLLLLKLHRKQIVITALIWLSVFLGATVSHAAHRKSHPGITYRTQLGNDLDGDHLPETAIIRQCGYVYHVSIHFSTGRPKLRLTTYVTEGVAGLSFQTTDVNNDSKGDLVIISATSIRPIGIWLNQGAKFQKVSSWFYGGVHGYTGPAIRLRGTSQPEPVGNIFADPLPQATLVIGHFALDDEAVPLNSSQADQRPFSILVRQIPPRGPPETAHF